MKSILFLSDSVNRRMLRLYSESGLHLPNLEYLASRSVVFDNHFTASAPPEQFVRMRLEEYL